MNDPKVRIYRLDKLTGLVEDYNGIDAVAKFCADFGVGRATAIKDLFALLCDPQTRFIQNVKVLYASDKELI